MKVLALLIRGTFLFGHLSLPVSNKRMPSCKADCNFLDTVMSHIRHGQGRKGDSQHVHNHDALNVYALGFLHTPFICVYRPRTFYFSQQVPNSLLTVKNWVQSVRGASLPLCGPKDTCAHCLPILRKGNKMVFKKIFKLN